MTIEVLALAMEYFWSAIQFWEVTFEALEALQRRTPRGLRLRFVVWEEAGLEVDCSICIVVALILIFAPLLM